MLYNFSIESNTDYSNAIALFLNKDIPQATFGKYTYHITVFYNSDNLNDYYIELNVYREGKHILESIYYDLDSYKEDIAKPVELAINDFINRAQSFRG